MNNSPKIFTLIKNEDERDLILSRLYSISDKLNGMQDDDYLDQVHNKVIEAIDWYLRFCDIHGYQIDTAWEHEKIPKDKNKIEEMKL